MKRVIFMALVGSAAPACLGQDLLPDLITRESDLYDNAIVFENGETRLRLANGTPNKGAGKLYLYGVFPGNPDNTQDVMQRIYRSDGTYWERLSGKFTYHPGHGHIHFDGWSEYRLRTILPGDGVGPVVATGGKTSFCILDLNVYDNTLPGFPANGQFRSCGTSIQGLSVGWMDIYSRGLDGQWINITGVPAGQYWLESEVDPDNLVLESDETNNAARIKVTIGGSGALDPDAYEPNDTRDAVAAQPVGQTNSSNLGPCGPVKTISGLSIHASNNADWFRFYMPATGTSSDSVQVTFIHAQGDIDMRLRDANGAQVASAGGTGNSEVISMNGRARGWYYVEVFGWNGARNPDYTLTINPSQNTTPSVSVIDPPAGDTVRIHGVEAYNVRWNATDANADPTWVSIYFNDTPTLDGTEVLIPTAVNLSGTIGQTTVNSADVLPGRYYVYARVTDGGTIAGAWSAGTISFLPPCPADMNGDRETDLADYFLFFNAYDAETAAADLDLSGTVDLADYFMFFDSFDAGCSN